MTDDAKIYAVMRAIDKYHLRMGTTEEYPQRAVADLDLYTRGLYMHIADTVLALHVRGK